MDEKAAPLRTKSNSCASQHRPCSTGRYNDGTNLSGLCARSLAATYMVEALLWWLPQHFKAENNARRASPSSTYATVRVDFGHRD